MHEMDLTMVSEIVKQKYGEAALRAASGSKSSCCGATAASSLSCDPITSNLYDAAQTALLPEEAVLASLGCGNPTALAQLNPGEVVLDLGSGGGIDVLLSAKRVGPTGKAYGLDMTDEMLALANENKRKAGAENVEFLKGSITAVPITDDHSFDVIVCFEAIEHIEDHDQLLKEVKRLLKADGNFIVSTPNKLTYHDEARDENPFHVRELYFDDFQKLLTGYFRNVSFLGQRVHPSSNIWPIGTVNASGIQEVLIEPTTPADTRRARTSRLP